MVSQPNSNGTSSADSSQLEERGWITLRKMSVLIAKSYQTTLKLASRGAIRAVRIGGTYRIYEDEVRRFLREGNHPDATPE